jgi:FkbM family methyltransferase
LSNTKRFYDRGWSGVNIEPDVMVFGKICRARPRDINLNIGIGKQASELTFYELSPNTLSTFSKPSALQSVKKEGAVIVSKAAVKVISLAELFRTTMPDKQVDFMSVDAEGFEFDILSSNDWKLYRPTAIIVELNQDTDCKVLNLMKDQGYVLISYNGTNGIFVDMYSSEIQTYLQN